MDTPLKAGPTSEINTISGRRQLREEAKETSDGEEDEVSGRMLAEQTSDGFWTVMT